MTLRTLRSGPENPATASQSAPLKHLSAKESPVTRFLGERHRASKATYYFPEAAMRGEQAW